MKTALTEVDRAAALAGNLHSLRKGKNCYGPIVYQGVNQKCIL